MDDLLEFFPEIPSDLASYFDQISDGSLSGHERVGVNLLPLPEVVKLTREFRSFHPVADALGGVLLDDANNSNHHVYLTAEACAGTVLYLDHDGDFRIVFGSLAEYVATCCEAISRKVHLRTLHPTGGVLLPDQVKLSNLIANLHRRGIEVEVILALIPSMDLTDFELLRQLAVHEVPEAVGDAIKRRPRFDLEPVAYLCLSHPHSVVVSAGERALVAIQAIEK